MSGNPELGAVFYCDGGSRPAPAGDGGFGIHGYTYHLVKDVKGDLEPSKTGKPKPTQYGYIDPKLNFPKNTKLVEPIEITDVIQALGHGVTNNQAELRAARDAVRLATEQGATRIQLLTDSQYVIKGYTERLPNWMANNWISSTGQEIKNKEDWINLHSEVKRAEELNQAKVLFDYVPGHEDNPGNEEADKYATRGVFLSRNKMFAQRDRIAKISKAQGYWNKDAPVSSFFTFPRAYFTTNREAFRTKDGRHVYFGGNTDNDQKGRLVLGKRISDSAYNVLYLKEPEPVLEMLRDHASKHLEHGESTAVYIAALSAAHSKHHYQDLLEGKCDFTMRPSLEGKSLHIPLGGPKTEQVLEVADPPNLVWRAIDELLFLQSLLDEWLESTKGGKTDLRVTDITDLLFETKADKKGKMVTTVHPKITPVTKSIKANVAYEVILNEPGKASCTLTLGLDLPARLNLGRLAAPETKAYVITYRESDVSFRCATIIQRGDDVGIWANVYSNPRYVLE